MRRADLPKCGTCDLTMPIEGSKDSLWCHGAPPDAFRELVVVMVEGQPTQEKRTSSTYPPVGKDMLGCAMHPQHPIGKALRKLGRGA